MTTPIGSPPQLHYSSATGGNNNKEKDVKFEQINITFFERKKLKKPTWFGKIDEDVVWEKWCINLQIIKEIEILKLSKQFEDKIWEICQICDKHKDHLPIITTINTLPYNYLISILTKDDNIDNWKSFIKKMLKEPNNFL